MGKVRCPSQLVSCLLGIVLTLPSCAHAVSTPIFFLPGMMLSNLSVTHEATGACSQAATAAQMWPPGLQDLVYGVNCWYQNIRLGYSNNRFVNGSGAEVTVVPFSSLASYPKMQEFVAQIRKKFPRYSYGKGLYALAYDWRLDLESLEPSYQLQQLAETILTNTNPDNRGILIGHSMGALVALKLLQLDSVRSRIKGFVSVAAPLGGAISAIPPRSSGDLKSFIDPEVLKGVSVLPGLDLDTLVRPIVWNAVQGLPVLGMMMPYATAFRPTQVLVRTPNKVYTVGKMLQLLQDIGDTQLAATYSQTHTLDAIVSRGPIAGVDIYCIYGSELDTAVSLSYAEPLTKTQNALPNVTYGQGDLVVPLSSLKLCDKLTTGISKVTRLPGVNGSHFGIYADSLAMRSITRIIASLSRQK